MNRRPTDMQLQAERLRGKNLAQEPDRFALVAISVRVNFG